jgi:ribosomal protein S18 acetylase RimI-like enzyme
MGCSVFEEGFPSVCLNVEPTNPAAVGVYGRIGFSGLASGVPGEGSEEWMECKWETAEV